MRHVSILSNLFLALAMTQSACGGDDMTQEEIDWYNESAAGE